MHDDDGTRDALQYALAAQRVLFTSPAAVRAAAALSTLRRRSPEQIWVAVGGGTAQALHQAGIADVASPTRMHSEGLLELACLRELTGVTVGVVTAPDGRDVLLPALRLRGAQLQRADVYSRVPIALSPQSLQKLRALDAPACLALSSEGALRQVLATAPAEIPTLLRSLPVVAASLRLQHVAQEVGFADVTLANGPLPHQLLAAIVPRFR